MISRTFPKPISSMKGATALNDGAAGLVPAPVAGDQAKFLRADGTWSNVQEMTGATEQAAGASGLVPAPAAGDQGKMLNGGGQWALPGVVTINGRSPNPVTGDIVVIEGGGSSSYGSYRLDAVIATTDWVEDNGAYVAQVTNSLITANMDGVETWLDDESAMLGDTSFATSEGMLTITTAVMPVASWSLHVSLAVNGADVLADVSALQTAVTNLQASDAAQTANMSKIIPILSGDTNNSGYTINSGEYFEVEGTLYKATAAIPNGSAWAGSATAMGAGETAINSLNSNMTPTIVYATMASGVSGSVKVHRVGKVRIVQGYANPGTGTNLQVATLDVGDRPSVQVYANVSAYNVTASGEASLGSDGILTVSIAGTYNNTLKFNFAYTVD